MVSPSRVVTFLLVVTLSFAVPNRFGEKEEQGRGNHVVEHFGCYSDRRHKVLPIFLGNFKSDSISACAIVAQNKGYKVLAIQNGRSCWSGPSAPEEFYKSRKSSRCNHGVGRQHLVDVYVFSHVKVTCPVATRRQLNPYCLKRVEKEIQENKKAYKLTPTDLNLYPSLNVTTPQLIDIFRNDPVNAEWLSLYLPISARNVKLVKKFLWKTKEKGEFTSVEDYKELLKFMVESQYVNITQEQRKFFRLYFMQQDKPFGRMTRLCNWREDRSFTDQRLAGNNPMTIQKVTAGSTIGVKWSDLTRKLSDSFKWQTALQDTLGMDFPIRQAINQGYLYVVHYPMLDGLQKTPTEPPSPIQGRKLMNAVSPIALFVSKPSTDKTKPNELVPMAIQMGHTKDSIVYTPNDGDKWLLAKQTVQVADFVHVGTVEHLLKLHLFVEPICVAVLRHFHSLHPLRQLLQFHCRGVMGTNKFNIENLIGEQGTSDRLFAIGYRGGYKLLQRGFEVASWDDTDFVANIKKRGMDDKTKVPYFPYRDDGRLVYRSIRNMVRDYVQLFYARACHVYSDADLQDFANEVSADGSKQPDGGNGMIKRFPTSITTRYQLIDMLTRLIWTTSAQHSVINYPSNYFGSYTPNMPTKLYHDPRVNVQDFDVHNLPGKVTAAIQVALGMNLASLRYDHLFDYGDQLKHVHATGILNKHSRWMNGFISTVIESRNRNRYKMNHLPYPYLIPGWIANSIHT